METYTWLRAFADSSFLIVMTAFFVGQILWTLRPGSRSKHASLAEIPLRNDTLPAEPDPVEDEDERP
ncbi:MAG: cbb3-type cytochrome c oxidase subunit 3 [Pseudomonadota bacterium]